MNANSVLFVVNRPWPGDRSCLTLPGNTGHRVRFKSPLTVESCHGETSRVLGFLPSSRIIGFTQPFPPVPPPPSHRRAKPYPPLKVARIESGELLGALPSS